MRFESNWLIRELKKYEKYTTEVIGEVRKKMRPIKFRGKRKDTGEWVYGYVVKFNDMKQKNPLGTMIYVYKDNKYYEVDPETVGEVLGLKDKNGKEIFESDIVKWKHLVEGRFYETHKVTDILEVKWEEDYAKFNISGLSTFDRKDMLMKDLEVIGNVWEGQNEKTE